MQSKTPLRSGLLELAPALQETLGVLKVLPDDVEAGGADAFLFAEALASLLSAIDNSGSNCRLDGLLGDRGGPVATINRRIKDCYRGSTAARLCVSGSSGANVALIGFTLPRFMQPHRGAVLVDRDAHCSIVGGLVVSGQTVYWVRRRYVEEFDVQAPISAAQVERELDRHPDIGAVCITSPTYDGCDAPIAALAAICHARGVLLVIDAAWAACHGALRDVGFPPTALELGADFAVVSPHKKGLAPSQISVALFRHEHHAEFFDMAGSLGMQTTSPNYVLIGVAEHNILTILEGDLAQHWRRAVEAAGRLRQLVGERLAGCRIINPADVGAESGDPCHVLLHVAGADVTGYALLQAMNLRGFDPEKATRDTLLILVGPREAPRIEAWIDALAEALVSCPRRGSAGNTPLQIPRSEPVQRRTVRDAALDRAEKILLTQAVGRTAAQLVAVYPPGSALFVPGEIIEQEHVDYLRAVRAAGGRIRGIDEAEPLKLYVTLD